MDERWQQQVRRLRVLEPPTDLWGRVLDRQPSGPGRLPRRPSRILAAVLALVVFAAGALAVWRAFSSGSVPPTASVWRSHTDPNLHWTISYPPAFHAYIESPSLGVGVGFRGIALTNFAFQHRGGGSGGSSPSDTRLEPQPSDVPATGILLTLGQWSGGPAFLPTLATETRFPIALSRFTFGTPFRPPVKEVTLPIQADGVRLTATLTVGRDASSSDLARLSRIVASIRFPHTRPGTWILDGQLLVLEAPGAYPVGSITKLSVPEAPRGARGFGPGPVYLVHATHGFYGLDLTDGGELVPGSAGNCPDLTFDPATAQFRCPANGARWDRTGKLLTTSMAKGGSGDDLAVLMATTSWDSHVMLYPGVSPNAAWAASLWSG